MSQIFLSFALLLVITITVSRSLRPVVFLCLQLPAGHVDVSVLVAVQLLIEQVTHEKNQSMLQQLHTHLLFNFNIWNKGDFPLRIGEIGFSLTPIVMSKVLEI